MVLEEARFLVSEVPLYGYKWTTGGGGGALLVSSGHEPGLIARSSGDELSRFSRFLPFFSSFSGQAAI